MKNTFFKICPLQFNKYGEHGKTKYVKILILYRSEDFKFTQMKNTQVMYDYNMNLQ